MRTGLVFLLRALAALTIACMAILAAVTAIGLVLIAVGALALADDYSLVRVAGRWVLATAGLLSVSRLAYVGACALGAGGDRDGSPAKRR